MQVEILFICSIRYAADQRGKMGQFILTGSAVQPDTDDITHSGTGRVTLLTLSAAAAGRRQ